MNDNRNSGTRITGPEWNRRAFLKAGGITVGGLGLASWLAACGGPGTTSNGGTLNLRMPFLADMQVPDPDIMYEGEGVQVMESAYEGLVRYQPGSSTIIGNLAKSWTVSPDQLTYTFTLQPGVKFHDGTPADAASWVKSFERRAKVDQGPAYMVAGVVKTDAPDPTTFVVTLKERNNAFIHYMACPWQPFAVSPTAVAKNAVGDDLAQEWLKTNDAGTGPYMFKEFVAGSHYLLEAFPDYWGPKPTFKTLRIDITPSVATQKLQLDSGAFDLVTKGFAIPDVLTYQKNSAFTVVNSFGGVGEAVWLNPTSGIFANKALRQAMLTALDRESVVTTSWGGLTSVQKGMWPDQTFSSTLAPFPSQVDGAALKALVGSLPSKKIDLAWSADGGAPRQQMTELLQTQLAAYGFDVTVRTIPVSEQFDLANQPPEKRPDMMVSFLGGDALHLDTTFRILARTGAKPLNFYQYSNPELDALMDKAVQAQTPEETQATYVQCSKIILDDALWIPLCLPPNSTISHSYVSGVEDNSFYPAIFWPQSLKRA
ncbi:peptide/nickel transport system substrate-binding protein [Mycolicibacterium sp. BK634]|uniref:ABC transporter substrate-binding protein n=1 Tax=Mycobacteriaceae TaxID=1762 RepID=UPI00105CE0FB|nr:MULTISPECIES: ABC transporter substrate-binding protein [Mycobacteriaceae]MBB3752824.1 peptide/nickel transport system substrate-binding protein [Mycolicibacterium sp. BK634]TDO17240.1 peptide/nickel transport system substrate-binding protein [Mycobacterium sp. BK086]